MKIGSNSQNLLSLASLLDATKQQQQTQNEQREKLTQNTRDDRLVARESEREQLIQQNRDALRKIQDDIRLKSLRRLQESEGLENNEKRDVNLNLRENPAANNLVANNQPAFRKIGQIVDLSV